MESNHTPVQIAKAYQSAVSKGLIREEDTAVIFYDLTYLENRVGDLKKLFPPATIHGIAMKANPLARILEFLKKLDTGVEVASLGELILARKAGYTREKIIYDSPVKTIPELEYALAEGVHINADSIAELSRIANLKVKLHSESTVGIRINPQVGLGKIVESSVAGEYSKFGVALKTGKNELVKAFRDYSWLTGVHLHVGSQGCPMEMLLNGIGVVYEFAEEVNEILGSRQINIFDLGGGFPVSYSGSEKPIAMEDYAQQISSRFPGLIGSDLKLQATGREPKARSPKPEVQSLQPATWRLITEFGRWVHVNSGWVASRIEYVKSDPGIKTAMIHVGADLFLRECLSPKDWQHEYSALDKTGTLKSGTDNMPYNLAGPLCFSGDILAKHIPLPVLEEGDTIIVHDTGVIHLVCGQGITVVKHQGSSGIIMMVKNLRS